MQRKTRRGKNWNRDDSGRPAHRASTWSKRSAQRDPKKNRRNRNREIDIQWVG